MRINCGQFGDELCNTEQVRLARDSLTKDGYVVLDRVIAHGKIAALADAFNVRHDAFDDRQRVGEGRFALPVDLAGPFADAAVYANPAIVAVVREILEQDAVLERFGAEVTLPGAGPQHIHHDGWPLFDSTISPLLPAHALTVVLPLVHYSVALWPKSHRWKSRNEDAPPDVVELPAGSSLLRDFRLFHSGMSNRSDRHRVALHIAYARRWYRDSGDLLRGDQAPLSLSSDFLAGVGNDERRLFAHVKPAGGWSRPA